MLTSILAQDDAPAPDAPSNPGIPTERLLVPQQVWDPLIEVLSYVLWAGTALCVAALVICGAVLVNQRKSTGTQVVEDATLVRILLCAAVIGSATTIANTILL
ncbi:hypothetical protein JO861_18975 [Rhodococcus hoagii]|uniref:hypothetical protein n=1 Tax=Rhodococcus hoagii TaxID=43767 RepID=UPI0019639BCA|nr:hypothetical protein [Prescottella equi]MBM9838634.1 hypothetical protein [Prescottella equi]